MADPVFSLAGQMEASTFDADPGDVDNSERMVSPKRPA
jgi:hypothetical protein